MRTPLPQCVSLLGVSLLFATAAPAQLQPGQFIATVIASPTGIPAFGEMYVGDFATRTVTQLTISAPLRNNRVNSVVMVSPSVGYVSTLPFQGSGDIFQITLTGTTVTESPVNNVALPGFDCAQLAVVGTDVLFVTRDLNGQNGFLGKVPIAGGVPTTIVDFSQVTGYARAPANALAVYQNLAFVCSMDTTGSTVTLPQLWQVDLATGTPTLVATLPRSRQGAANANVGVVNLQFETTVPSFVVIQGNSGDLLRYEVTTATLIDHRFSGPAGAQPGINALGALFIDPVDEDYLMGTQDGAVDLFAASGHTAERVVPGLGSVPQSQVTGIWYRPHAAGRYPTYGAGCPGAGGFTPTSFGGGAVTAGNAAFGFGLASGNPGTPALLFVGRSNMSWLGVPLPLDLTTSGLPGCFLRTGPIFTLSAALTGSPRGLGVVPFPLPAGTTGISGFTQWLTLTPQFTLDAVSDGRQFTIQ